MGAVSIDQAVTMPIEQALEPLHLEPGGKRMVAVALPGRGQRLRRLLRHRYGLPPQLQIQQIIAQAYLIDERTVTAVQPAAAMALP
jgi:hypothetical protein